MMNPKKINQKKKNKKNLKQKIFKTLLSPLTMRSNRQKNLILKRKMNTIRATMLKLRRKMAQNQQNSLRTNPKAMRIRKCCPKKKWMKGTFKKRNQINQRNSNRKMSGIRWKSQKRPQELSQFRFLFKDKLQSFLKQILRKQGQTQ